MREPVSGNAAASRADGAFARARRFAAALLGRLGEHRTFTFAAALAYYFLFALFPFVLFLLAFVTVLPGVAGIEDWLLAQAAAIPPPEGHAVFAGVVRSLLAQPRSGLLSLGAALALWSASTALVAVADALNVAYGIRERRPWWRVRLECMGLTAVLSVFMIVAFAASVASSPLSAWVARLFGELGGYGVLAATWVVALGAVTVVIATLYHRLPDIDRPWRWFSPGSLVFTLGFTATSAGFSAWVARFGGYDKTYGSLGALIVLLLWMYLLAVFVLVGGEIDAMASGGAGPALSGATAPPPPRSAAAPPASVPDSGPGGSP